MPTVVAGDGHSRHCEAGRRDEKKEGRGMRGKGGRGNVHKGTIKQQDATGKSRIEKH